MSKHDLPDMVFVVGAPRSGSRLLLDFLTVPKNVGWIPQKLADNPEKLSLAVRANKLNWPLLGEFYLERRSYWKSVPEPAVGEAFWEHYLHSFTPADHEPFVPAATQVDASEADRVVEAVKQICHVQRRNRFVAEYSGFPRIDYMRAIFPEAKFIQVIRDPRSVAYQMVKRADGANLKVWEAREQWKTLMPEALKKRMDDLPQSPLNFCGILVRWFHELYKEEMAKLPEGDALEVAYSDLLSRPEKVLTKVMSFVNLPQNTRFKYYVKFHDIQQSNQRTNRSLNADEADQLEQAVAALDD
ncbi:sulfotransferase [Kiritimatiellota bacterium B12222]|nr:sulfotransferase [Kiritimatiellota bacterium B12222]